MSAKAASTCCRRRCQSPEFSEEAAHSSEGQTISSVPGVVLCLVPFPGGDTEDERTRGHSYLSFREKSDLGVSGGAGGGEVEGDLQGFQKKCMRAGSVGRGSVRMTATRWRRSRRRHGEEGAGWGQGHHRPGHENGAQRSGCGWCRAGGEGGGRTSREVAGALLTAGLMRVLP